MEKLREKWWLLFTATSGGFQDDRNVVTVALRLIKPMGNMPFYKEIIMFEKRQKKNDYKSQSCLYVLLLNLKKKTRQIKNPSNQPKTCFTACVVSSQCEANKTFFEQNLFCATNLTFLLLASILPSQSQHSLPPESSGHSVSSLQCLRPSFIFLPHQNWEKSGTPNYLSLIANWWYLSISVSMALGQFFRCQWAGALSPKGKGYASNKIVKFWVE